MQSGKEAGRGRGLRFMVCCEVIMNRPHIPRLDEQRPGNKYSLGGGEIGTDETTAEFSACLSEEDTSDTGISSL